jgi:hypothetical protein
MRFLSLLCEIEAIALLARKYYNSRCGQAADASTHRTAFNLIFVLMIAPMPSQEEINEQEKLLATHRRTLGYNLERLAKLGSAQAPAGLLYDIDDGREATTLEVQSAAVLTARLDDR